MINKILIYLLVAIASYAVIQKIRVDNLTEKLTISNNNTVAYNQGVEQWRDKYNKEHIKTVQFQETIYSLTRSNDTLDIRLVKAIKEAKIKRSQLDQAGILITQLKAELGAKNTDTTYIIDDSTRCQTLSDSTFLTAEVCFTPKSVRTLLVYGENEQDILFTHQKETIAPRRRFFIRRWLQKKQIVCKIEVINSNPYITTTDSKFTEIIK